MRGVRSHLTYANVISSVCLFFILAGGAAYAADTIFSEDIVDGEVKTADIGNNQVQSADVRDDTLANGGLSAADLGPDAVGASEVDGSLTGADVADEGLSGADINGLTGADVNDGGLSGADINGLTGTDVNDGSLTGVDVLDGGLTGADIADNGLAGADINEATLGIVPNANTLDGLDSPRFKNANATGTGQCLNLASATTCASASVGGLTSGDDVYVSASWQWYGDGVGEDAMACSIKRGAVNLESTRIGQSGNEHLNTDTSITASLNTVDPVAPAGTVSYSLVCSEVDGAVNVLSARVVAIRMSG